MSETTASPRLKEALDLHRQGFPTRAIPLYERILVDSPEDAETLSLYGLALVQGGRPSEAEAPLRRAIEKEPNQPGFRANLAELFFRIGDEEAGIEELEKVKASHPTYAPALVSLGRKLVARRDLPGAADAFDLALKARPNDLNVAQMLAATLAELGDFGACYFVLDHAEKIMPDNIDTLKIRLDIARNRRDFSAMRTLAGRLTTLAPADPIGWRDLATTLYEEGLFSDAAFAFEKAITLTGRDAETLSQLAAIAIQALDFAGAEAALDEAEQMSPHHPRMLSTRALLLTYQGKKDEAIDYCERCILADPSFFSVYPQLSVLRGGRLTPEEEARLRERARRSDIAPEGRASAGFVLAHSLEARGEYEAAFEEYSNANAKAAERNRRDQQNYDVIGHTAWTDAIIHAFPGAPAGGDAREDGAAPIFIVGLPRCGSTLVESVIAAHSKVRAGGEMPMMPNLFNRWFRENHAAGTASLSDDARQKLADLYMKGAPASGAATQFTDKNLLNLEAAGFIAMIFPNAKIINVRRNPVENSFAIWRQDMLKYWAFATDFEDIANRYGLYAKLADHFERTLPGRFHTIQYEDFVTDFDHQSRQLIKLCGLEWEDACADFQSAREFAPTMSAMQVREGVSLKGDRAARYGAKLDPLRRALAAAGVDLATGTRAR